MTSDAFERITLEMNGLDLDELPPKFEMADVESIIQRIGISSSITLAYGGEGKLIVRNVPKANADAVSRKLDLIFSREPKASEKTGSKVLVVQRDIIEEPSE